MPWCTCHLQVSFLENVRRETHFVLRKTQILPINIRPIKHACVDVCMYVDEDVGASHVCAVHGIPFSWHCTGVKCIALCIL